MESHQQRPWLKETRDQLAIRLAEHLRVKYPLVPLPDGGKDGTLVWGDLRRDRKIFMVCIYSPTEVDFYWEYIKPMGVEGYGIPLDKEPDRDVVDILAEEVADLLEPIKTEEDVSSE